MSDVTATHNPESPLDPWPGQVTWQPLSPKYVLVRLVRLAAGTGGLALAALAGWWLTGAWILGVLAAAAVLTGLVRAPFVARQVRSWGYAERGEDLLIRHGLLIRRLTIVPYARMQFVDVSAGPVDRLFGLATVQMHTAASGVNASVPGLAPPEAVHLRDRLAALGRARTEGL
ncbi:PH domain-containing protein [Longispora albida]|uniref:PH domain-containing protein n=1 Tax=Longispora albida TaxID=203523 RepID=UPI0003823637|nr:PH domain-containing protein [Longispora albida]